VSRPRLVGPWPYPVCHERVRSIRGDAGVRLAVAPLDYSEPVDTTAFYKNVLRPALAAVGLPASTPGHDARGRYAGPGG
jgi:hypothetical protein